MEGDTSYSTFRGGHIACVYLSTDLTYEATWPAYSHTLASLYLKLHATVSVSLILYLNHHCTQGSLPCNNWVNKAFWLHSHFLKQNISWFAVYPSMHFTEMGSIDTSLEIKKIMNSWDGTDLWVMFSGAPSDFLLKIDILSIIERHNIAYSSCRNLWWGYDDLQTCTVCSPVL